MSYVVRIGIGRGVLESRSSGLHFLKAWRKTPN